MASPRNVTAVLGPTNTGKTHLAVERMLAHPSGMIGLPLRLLAREVYDRVRARVGEHAVALVTGEEKIIPADPRFWVATVEAMPSDHRGARSSPSTKSSSPPISSAATSSPTGCCTRRGQNETMLLGAATMRSLIDQLLPGTTFISRPRFSKLSYSGQKKLTRLPRRSAIVAFSAEMVYAVAELIRRQSGGAAVVLGALSPRTRNAQVALYPVRRCRLCGGDRCDRHGPQHGCRPCRLRRDPEIRRLLVPPADRRRAWPDCRSRRPLYE